MIGEVGTLLIGLALITSGYAVLAALLGIIRKDRRWTQSAKNATYSLPMLLGIAVILLSIAFLTNHFEFSYIARNSSRDLPIYLKFSAVWAGQEGSLLLWSFLQALFTALAIRRPSKLTAQLLPWAAVFMNSITAFFVAVTLLLSNPFETLPLPPADGLGLNPLLRHPGMIFHPPAMYVGYVGLAVPFASALAALVTGNLKHWTAAIRSWTLVAWIGLGLGLLLGMRWAYDVLGWGGYWGWDPVENAGLMPWLTTTAFLHGAIMQDEQRGFQIGNFLLIIFSYALVLFGTFATRSGAIQSVHAYAESDIGIYFMVAIVVVLVGSLALLVWRRARLKTTLVQGGLLSRSGMFFLTLVLLSTLTFSVFVGSVLPTLTDLLTRQKFEAGPAWFDRVTGPQFAALVLIMGICPILGRSAQALSQLKKWRWLAVGGAASAVILAAAAGFTQGTALLGFAVVGLASATALGAYGKGLAARHRHTGRSLLHTVRELVQQQPRRYGGYLVHIGIIFMAVGIIGTRLYPFEEELTLTVGKPEDIRGYTLLLEGLKQNSENNTISTWANIAAYKDTQYLVTLTPATNRYMNFEQAVGVPALKPGIREDLYLILAGWSRDGRQATVKVMINPLANFLWLGGLLFLAGGVLAVWPKHTQVGRKESAAPENQQIKVWRDINLILTVSLFIGAGWTMWGMPHGTIKYAQGRPLPGQSAPAFQLTLLDGTQVSLPDQSPQATVVSFWAPWCASCEEGLSFLQSTWGAYQDHDIAFIGIAHQSDRASVENAVSRYGVTYPVGIDTEGSLAKAYGITGVPEIFILDAEGEIAYLHIGLPEAETFIKELDTLIGEPIP